MPVADAGTNTIHFTGVDPSHIIMWTDTSGNLHLEDTTNPSENVTVYAGETGSGTHESTIGDYAQQVTFDTSYGTTVNLTGGLTLTAPAGGGNLYGTAHDDTLIGGAGSDNLYGNGGNNTLISGGGSDYMYGGSGNNTFVFGSGFSSSYVTPIADAGTNTIHITGIDPANFVMRTDSSGNMHIEDTTNASQNITIYAGETGSGTHESTIGDYAQQVTFDSSYGTTLNLTGGLTLTAADGGGNLYGTGNGDTLNGSSSGDNIYANAGNNLIYGGGGDDTINLGTGADTVLFKGATAETGVDTIYNFDTAKSDKLDIADVISTYDPLTMLISNFVELTTSGGNTQLKVDTDGSGTNYTQIATLSGVTGLNLSDLIADGSLIVHHA
jgi:Ca2+-binding RTX toxin-like protein